MKSQIFILLSIIFFLVGCKLKSGKIENYDNSNCEKPKYANKYSLPNDILVYYDYNQGLKCAKQKNKPVFLTFTAYNSVSCKKFLFKNWLNNADIHQILKKNYVVIALYVDEKSKLDSNEFYISKYSHKQIETVGGKNSDYQISRFQNNSQPFSVVLDTNGNKLLEALAYTPNDNEIIEFMKNGIVEYKKTNANK
jgi:thiol:disulfide interchange protein DsbD